MESSETPDVLTQVSKEKFRRKLLISSRIIAVLLIGALIYFSVVYYQVGNSYKTNPCWSCGYYEGKRCDPVLIHAFIPNQTYLEEMRLSVAEYNARPINISEYNIQRYNQDLKSFNLTIINATVIKTFNDSEIDKVNDMINPPIYVGNMS